MGESAKSSDKGRNGPSMAALGMQNIRSAHCQTTRARIEEKRRRRGAIARATETNRRASEEFKSAPQHTATGAILRTRWGPGSECFQ